MNISKMPQSQKFIIKGTPIAWARAGHNGTRMYDAQAKAKLDLMLQIESQRQEKKILDGSLSVHFDFYFTTPKTKKNHSFHCGKPDIDNLVKFVLDTCNGSLYHDDSQISFITAKKWYDHEPRTEFSLFQLV
jgi:Holliday junction resolvase RusA-like endonuclease